jgi:hypothetical protein
MNTILNYHILKKTLLLFIGLCPFFNFANDLSDYQLKSVSSQYYYYNFCKKGEELYIGSDHGILKFIHSNQISIQDNLQKGYVYIENDNVIANKIYISGIATPQYTNVLPQGFKNNAITGIPFKNYILVISKGQLFIYKRGAKTFSDSLSIRSISKNFLGTYNGIFYKGQKTSFKYTNGYIREFPGESFICYDGLYRILPKKTVYFDNLGGAQFSNLYLGFARDIYKINSQQYLIFTTKGLFSSNLSNQARLILKVAEGNEPRFINTMDRAGIPIFLFFSQNNKLYQYTIKSGQLKVVLQLDNSLGEIEDCYFDPYEMGKIYIITQDKLLKANTSLSNKYGIEVLEDHMDSNHHLVKFNDSFLIPSNSGLSVYNLTTNELSRNIIRDEFNKRAFYVADGIVNLGTIHGYYKLNQADINRLTAIASDEKEIAIQDAYSSNYILYLLGLVCLILIVVCVVLFKKSKQSIAAESSVSESDIIQFIDENIASVTIQNICEQFKINTLQLNDILKSDKPGQLIRKKRMEIVTKMRKQKKDIDAIATASGFSVSYLKKIKG